jgi:glycine dehydrogenase
MKLYTGQTDHFVNRHNGSVNQEDIERMLKVIGVNSVDELISKTVPYGIRMQGDLNISDEVSEQRLLQDLKKTASKNQIFKNYIGMGYYNCYTPGVVLRNIMENPGWYTQYTPYQAEIAQGRLEALLNYQTMIIDLTGLPITNASLLDEGTAAAEAMAMFRSLHKSDHATKFFVDAHTYPQTIDVLKTRSEPMGIELVIGDYKTANFDEHYFGAFIQYPNNEGNIEDYAAFTAQAHAANVLVCVGADLLSLSMLTPPGEWGADCVVGTSQRFGVPLGYGGPHAGYFATKDEYKRQIPGRIIGVSIDRHGNRALRMALQTREQHIRRQNATSNICTAQVLLSIMAGMFGVYHGPDGVKKIAAKTHGLAKTLEAGLKSLGYNQANTNYFDTLLIDSNGHTAAIRLAAEAARVNLRYFANGHIGVSIDETIEVSDLVDLLNVFAKVAAPVNPKVLARVVAPVTETVLARVAAPVRPSVLENVTAPVTNKVLAKVAVFVTSNVFDSVTAPTTFNVLDNRVAPETFAVPVTTKTASGALLLIPTRLLVASTNRTALSKFTLPAIV